MAMYAKVRRMRLRDGLSISEIARRTSLSRNTIKTWLRTVVLMTAFGTPEIAKGALDLGVRQVLHKPFEMHDLKSLVEGACSTGNV